MNRIAIFAALTLTTFVLANSAHAQDAPTPTEAGQDAVLNAIQDALDSLNSLPLLTTVTCDDEERAYIESDFFRIEDDLLRILELESEEDSEVEPDVEDRKYIRDESDHATQIQEAESEQLSELRARTRALISQGSEGYQQVCPEGQPMPARDREPISDDFEWQLDGANLKALQIWGQ